MGDCGVVLSGKQVNKGGFLSCISYMPIGGLG